MKKILTLSLMLIAFLLLACQKQKGNSNDVRDLLIEELIEHAQTTQSSKKITIISTGFCSQNDCTAYFKAHQDKIQVMKIEDAFMRAIKDYIEVVEINTEEGVMKLVEKKNGKAKSTILNLGLKS